MGIAILHRRSLRPIIAGALLAAWALVGIPPSHAMIVAGDQDTKLAPPEDPGWNNFSIPNANPALGSRKFTYLGDYWALAAFHTGPQASEISHPAFTETVTFPTGEFDYIPGQVFQVPNPASCSNYNGGQACSAFTDLRLVRLNPLNGAIAPPTLSIASQEITEATPIANREVMFITRERERQPDLTTWTATVVAGSNPPNDSWVTPGTTHTGYKTSSNVVKNWGTNQIADEEALFGGNDNDLRQLIRYQLGVGPTDVVSLATVFNENGLDNEAQAVIGDSSGAVFFKRNGVWELLGIINGVRAPVINGSSPPTAYDRLPDNNASAPYGSQTLFADLSFYRNSILSVMQTQDLIGYSVAGDINLDGVASGDGTGPWESDDMTAFVAGWKYDNCAATGNCTGVGDIHSWKKGDLNRDGKVDVADFLKLRTAINGIGSGGTSLADLLGGAAPEPSALLLALLGALPWAVSRPRRPDSTRD